jgi:micrococcal nuclease
MRRSLLLCLLAAAGLACAPRLVLVERVIDGDTIILADSARVRYIGVDTPESVHPRKSVQFMAKEASDFNRRLVEGRKVRLEYDVDRTDRYGRTLAYVYLDTLFVNAELVRQGYAQLLTIPPNVKYVDLFKELQKEAREENRGLWNAEAAARWASGH